MTRAVPAGLLNARYTQLPGWSIRCLAQEKGVYNAFPKGLRRFDDTIVAIWSSGPAGHGNSARQPWMRSTGAVGSEFDTFDEGVFYENATGAFDASFLDDLLPTGDVASFTPFSVRNTGTGLATSITSTVIVSGDTYALWGSPIYTGGKWYVSGYRTATGYRRPALFESTDQMQSWQFVALISAVNTKQLGETSLIKCLNGDLLAVQRDDSNLPARDLYLSRCTTGVSTWSTPALLPSHVRGTQPNLLRLSSGAVLLFFGVREGSSALDDAGNHVSALDTTGLAYSLSIDNGVTWGPRTMIAPSWSTDCGQVLGVELADGRVGVMCYLSPAATGTTTGVEAGIYWVTFRLG